MSLLLALWLGACVPYVSVSVGTPTPTPTPTATPIPVDAEAEYYRGAWDFCMKAVDDKATCDQIIPVMMDSGWYEMPSDGWNWPMHFIQPTLTIDGLM